MIEKIILDYLNGKMNTPAYMEEPEEAPDTFILIQKMGSSRENRICSAMLAIQSFGRTLYEAALLNEKIKKVMEEAVSMDSVCSVRLNSDYDFTDTSKKRHRYQAIFDITHY